MRKTISGLVAAVAVMTAGAVPAMACGGGLFTSCSPCGQEYASPCGQPQVYQAPVYVAPAPTYSSGCNTGCGGWAHERLPDPVHQYYYVNQGPTYTGPGNFAPVRTYQENALPNWGAYRHHYGHRPHYGYRYGYAPRHMRYGMMPHRYGYGYREHTLRRYY
jgi:hypothetical protein